MTATVHLNPGKEKSLQRRHPWVFSGAIDRVSGNPASGETVLVRSAAGGFLAQAAWSGESQIRCRAWTWREGDKIDAAFFRERVRAALARRAELSAARGPQGALRLVHSESDHLPGIVADRYADTVVVQFFSAGAERWREAVADALLEATGCARVFERSDADVRELEGLPLHVGALRGDEPPPRIEIREAGLAWRIDPRRGHKTGFYLDQADNRALVADLAAGAEVLDAFCYTGGFSLNALAGGAERVLSIDSSADALALARENAEANGLADGRAEWLEGDVFATLRKLRDQGRSFDLVILDPPKFAPTAAHAERASRAYKDINLWALKLLRPGGRLLTFSCSGGVGADLFRKIVAGAAADAGAELIVERALAAGADHPVLLSFPEGEYLKGLVLRRE